MSLLKRLFPSAPPRPAPLYAAAVAEARRRDWYAVGGAPDTFDGRFDMLAAVVALILIRLEADGEAGAADGVRLFELWVDDMDGHVRERGIGDLLVGKHVGRMVAALGGRVDAYRAGLAGDDAAFAEALRRNLWRGTPPDTARPDWMAARLRELSERLARQSRADLLEGRL
ncbi:ubiquinol-cytochrome C chaperone family protein [Sphingomonas jatrophae]|uniref:Cytochrome b pre-mRNA-processing protein 3 n=1 Tax=Sphingomonas jatrophae TaxID=1166337 RepID=A0A1I6LQ13_9SPHN|nr:ubiquinol-cytochrome C chaperone family protein [Sphingomonas jatrophae]SFS05352.1 cytochrome b pre-mRNA-processing protein 3 [Sphingomonas jatrophae]